MTSVPEWLVYSKLIANDTNQVILIDSRHTYNYRNVYQKKNDTRCLRIHLMTINLTLIT